MSSNITNEPIELDEARVAALAGKLSDAIKLHYIDGPPSRAKVFELLNAYAVTLAPILVGSEGDASGWFFTTLIDAICDLQRRH